MTLYNPRIMPSKRLNILTEHPRLLIVLLLAFFVSGNLAAQHEKIDSFITRQMKEQGINGLSIAIVKNGKVFLTKGYGLANVELNAKASANTVYKIASISKQFIALAVMRLVQEKKLSLSDPVSKFIIDAPESWKSITIRHLLHHTSGLPAEPPGFDPMKEVPDSVYIHNAFADTLAYSTNSKFEYSNFGYFVLADIIRIASHIPFDTFMKKNVFDALNMSDTRTTSATAIIANRASGYTKDEHNVVCNATPVIAMRPSGAFLSSVNDLTLYELAIQHEKLITSANWHSLFTDTVKTPFSMDNQAIYYAYGWMTNLFSKQQLLHHGGSLPGFKSVYFRLPKTKSALIVLTNSEDADAYQIAFGILDILNL